MTDELKIERYLLLLDRELSGLPTSQRAEIITEIKSHIKEAPGGVDRALNNLGSPQTVAEKYLAARGMAFRRARASTRWFKWLAIGTVGFFACVILLGLTAIWYFSPLVKVDHETGKIALLGGLINVDDDIGRIKIGELIVNDAVGEGVSVKGEEPVSAAVRALRIPFNTAKLDLAVSEAGKITWDCQVATDEAPEVAMEAGVLTLNLDKLNLAKCTVGIPKGLHTEVRGVNGHMDIAKPGGPLDIKLDNGKVNILPDPSRVYDFEVKVKNGLQDFFPRSSAKQALKVKVNIVNGMVKKE